MNHARGRGLRGALLAAVAGTLSLTAAPALAQGGADLRRQLTTLADNPNSVAALIDAGRAALDHGDGTAALGFFTRAADLSPRDARAKAGLAAAHVHNGNALEALRLFNEAQALGISEAALAGDRGLAYDLLGQPARAQQDYVLALRHREDPEVRRRLSVSLAISGQREPALRVIEGLVRSGDRASLRTRALVLALSGDSAGAGAAARASMPAATASAMVPFLQRMSNLSPVQMASAAHLGRFPTSGSGVRSAAAADPAALAFAGGSASPLAARLPVAAPAGAVRRRPDASTASPRQLAEARQLPSRPLATSAVRTSAPTVAVAVRPGFILPHPREPLTQLPAMPTGTVRAAAAPTPTLTAQVAPSLELAGAGGASAALPAAVQPAAVPDASAWERLEPVRMAAAAAASTTTPAQPTAALETPAPSGINFAEVAAAISALPVEAEPTSAPSPVRAAPQRVRESTAAPRSSTSMRTTAARPAASTTRTAAAASRTAAAAGNRTPARAQAPAQRHPARIWVQIATVARTALPGEFARLRRTAPEALRSRSAYTAPLGGNGRLLVGPFATQAEARAFINRLDREDISAFAWSSTAGQEVAQVPAGR